LQSPSGLTGDRAAAFAAFKQIQDAFFGGDRATYQKLTAMQHVRLSPGGILRAAAADGVGTGIDGPRAQPKYSHVSVQAWGPIAVVRWHETNPAGQSQWLTRVMAKEGAGWQAVATASSMAANPPVTP
jgi:hypothetical protein